MTRCADWFTADDLNCDAQAQGATGYMAQAMDWVYAATGGQWPGACQSTIRPTFPCQHRSWCDCRTRWQKVDLTLWVQGPIVSIDSVTVDGAIVPADQYRLDNGRYLAAQYDGPGGTGTLIPWPNQDLRLASGVENTWSLTVTHGAVPPLPVIGAAKDLACQLLRRAAGGECDLPDNTTSVTQDGVSISLAIPTDGRTGIPRIDSILELYGRNRTRRRILDPMAEHAPVTRL